MSTGSDRREYFRIDDSIQVSFREVDPEELGSHLEALGEESHSDQFTVASQIISMRHESGALLRKISEHSPDIGAYLASMDRRLEILARAFSANKGTVDQQPVKTCNISASGLALHVNEPVKEGVYLEMRLLLMPSYTGLLVYGEVVSCQRQRHSEGEEDFLIRVNFSHIRESDRDLLIKHVIQRQGELLRLRREQRGSQR
jgi:hypothetical protein